VSAAEHETVAPEGGNEQRSALITRAVAEITPGDGRTLDVRIVPYNVVTTVSDPGRPAYREQWMPGAFADQVRGASAGRANTVLVNYRHGDRISDVLGHGLTLNETGDGFYGTFRVHETPDGDKALYMVRENVLAGVSLEALPKKSVRSNEGIVQRVKAHLVNIALCPNPAYEGAGVLALREEDLMVDEELEPLGMDPALVERCLELGIEVPGRIAEVIQRAFTEVAWDGSASRWDTPEAYCAASAIDLNAPGSKKTKDACHLPFKEPGSGAVNVNGLRAALSRLGQGFPNDATQAQRDSAAARLRRLLASYNSSSGGN
jgi:Escherichia/Staphylococcus phage prohead protease